MGTEAGTSCDGTTRAVADDDLGRNIVRGKLTLLIGLGAGYVLGTRSGRERYDQMAAKAKQVWRDPRVQEKASQAQHVAQEKAGQAGHVAKEKVGEAAGQAGHAVKGKFSSSSDDSSSSTSPTGAPARGTSGATAGGPASTPEPPSERVYTTETPSTADRPNGGPGTGTLS